MTKQNGFEAQKAKIVIPCTFPGCPHTLEFFVNKSARECAGISYKLSNSYEVVQCDGEHYNRLLLVEITSILLDKKNGTFRAPKPIDLIDLQENTRQAKMFIPCASPGCPHILEYQIWKTFREDAFITYQAYIGKIKKCLRSHKNELITVNIFMEPIPGPNF